MTYLSFFFYSYIKKTNCNSVFFLFSLYFSLSSFFPSFYSFSSLCAFRLLPLSMLFSVAFFPSFPFCSRAQKNTELDSFTGLWHVDLIFTASTACWQGGGALWKLWSMEKSWFNMVCQVTILLFLDLCWSFVYVRTCCRWGGTGGREGEGRGGC